MARKKITQLTSEQESYLPVFRDKWRSVGLNTESIDRTKAETAVKNLYRSAGLAEPIVLFFDSPYSCLIARATLKKIGLLKGCQLRYKLRGSIGDKLRGSIGDQLFEQIQGQLWDPLLTQLRCNLQGHLREKLQDPIENQLWVQLRSQLRSQLHGRIQDQLWEKFHGPLEEIYDYLWFIGGWDSFWLAFYAFTQVLGVHYKNQQHLDAYTQYAMDCGVMYPYKGFAFCSDRAEVLRFDEHQILHSEDGYAMKFRDGYGFCSRHGVRKP